MASITITIPDAQAPRIVSDVARYRGVDISAMTLAQKVAFLKSDIRDYWIDIMRQVESPAVLSTANTTAQNTLNADIAANVTVS